MKEFDKCIIGMERKNAFMAGKDPNYVPETEITSYMKKISYSEEYTVSCPVDIEVFDADGNMVFLND